MDDKSKIIGAQKGAETMLYYYLSSLIDAGVKDPKQKIATELGKIINLSEEQIQYVRVYLQNKNSMMDGLSCSVDLLNKIKQTEKLSTDSIDSIKIVIATLETMLRDGTKAVKEHCVVDDE